MDVLQGYDGRVSGVLTDRGPRLARWVFDASGGRHWLTRRLGAKATRISKPLVARFGWNNKGKPEPEYSHSARAEPVLRIGPRGWMWTAPLGDGHAAWVDVAFDAGGRRRGVTLPTSGLRDPLGGADVTWRRAPRVSGPGFVVIGDAGAVLDPAASRGVLRALMTGCVAAQCVVDALACRIREEDLMTRYARWHDDWFARDAAALAELYSGAGFQARRIIVPSLSPPRANAVHVVSSETRP
jgi:flavin-dependent dehydrogenase